MMRMDQRAPTYAAGMIQYYWSAIIGTGRSLSFAALMRQEGFDRFEEALEEFRGSMTRSYGNRNSLYAFSDDDSIGIQVQPYTLSDLRK